MPGLVGDLADVPAVCSPRGSVTHMALRPKGIRGAGDVHSLSMDGQDLGFQPLGDEVFIGSHLSLLLARSFLSVRESLFITSALDPRKCSVATGNVFAV